MITARWGVPLVLCVVAVTALPGGAVAQTVLLRSVLGSGGSVGSNAFMGSVGTVGQPAIGVSQDHVPMVAFHGYWKGGTLLVTGIGDDLGGDAESPTEVLFGAPAPNPSHGRAEFELWLPAAASVRLSVLDVTGRLVAVSRFARLDAGRHRVPWDGRELGGGTAPGGIYYAKLEVNGRIVGRRSMAVIR